MHDGSDRETKKTINAPHPFGVARGEIIVDRNHMHAASRERVEIDRQRRDQRLTFAGFHLRDLAFVQDHPADQLHIEMALTERALGALAARRQKPERECRRATCPLATSFLKAAVRARSFVRRRAFPSPSQAH